MHCYIITTLHDFRAFLPPHIWEANRMINLDRHHHAIKPIKINTQNSTLSLEKQHRNTDIRDIINKNQ